MAGSDAVSANAVLTFAMPFSSVWPAKAAMSCSSGGCVLCSVAARAEGESIAFLAAAGSTVVPCQ